MSEPGLKRLALALKLMERGLTPGHAAHFATQVSRMANESKQTKQYKQLPLPFRIA